jgi:hypothetical protein
VCKYVDTPGGQLQGGGNPIEVSLNTLNNVVDATWLANPTFPKSWNDAHGQSGTGGGSIAIGYVGEGLDISDCTGTPPPEPVVCPEGTDHQGETVPEGETIETFCNDVEAPVCAEGTDNAGQTIPEGQTAEEFCNDVEAPVCAEGTDNAGQTIPEGQTAEGFCTDTVVVSPPGGGGTTTVVSPPKAHTPKAHTPKAATVTTPTVVHAGLSSVSTQDLRGEQGLALMVAGMVMLVAAGGLGLRVRGVASRI